MRWCTDRLSIVYILVVKPRGNSRDPPSWFDQAASRSSMVGPLFGHWCMSVSRCLAARVCDDGPRADQATLLMQNDSPDGTQLADNHGMQPVSTPVRIPLS